MSLFDWLWPDTSARFRPALAWIVLFCISMVAIFSIVISVINHIGVGQNFTGLIPVYTVLLVSAWTFRYLAMRTTFTIVEEVSTQIRVRICASLLTLPLIEFEQSDRALARQALTQFPRAIAEVALLLDRAVLNCLLQFFGFLIVSLFYADQPALQLAYFGIVATAVVVCVIVVLASDRTQLTLAEESQNGFADLIDGFKEVRLDPNLFKRLTDDVINAQISKAEQGRFRIQRNSGWAFGGIETLALFIVVTIAVLPESWIDVGHDQSLRLSMVALILPASLFLEIPNFVRIHGIIARLRQLINDLESGNTRAENWLQATPPILQKSRLKSGLVVDELEFRYPDQDSVPGFAIGPVSFHVPAGSMTFFTGGNGSGKSTILKTTIGLYPHTHGQIRIDGQTISPLADKGYFSAIFTDSHLFDRVYGYREIDQKRLNACLEEFGLSDKTQIKNGRLTNIDLSTGQRKRVALAIAMIEDRPVWALDEWAADQDPEFRHWFYTEILPAERARGRTIIVVTHDEPYFSLADQVLEFEFGKLRDVREGS